MASDFQRRKVGSVFAAMDKRGRGFLVEDDFEALAVRWTTLRGLPPGTDQSVRLRTLMLGWWSTLSSTAQDGARVHLDDVMTLVDHLPAMTGAMTATADAMFVAIDANADQRISRAEYRELIEAWNGCPTDTDEVFALLDLDSDGYISRDEFRQLWREFWAGDDPQEPGTWVFGRFGQPSETAR